MILGTFTKQPSEIQDYDIDFNEYLTSMGGDSIVGHTVLATDGITVQSSLVVSGVVKIFLSGGTTGGRYVVTARVTTNGGRVREGEIVIRVKEY